MNRNEKKRGFAGISSLASQVEKSTPVSRTASEPQKKPKPPQDKSPTTQKHDSPREPRPSPPKQPPPQLRKPGTSIWTWILASAAVAGTFVAYNKYQDELPKRYAVHSPPTNSHKTDTGASTSKPANVPEYKPAPTRREAEVSFVRPSVGRNHVLSVAQIRWCLREGIRLDVKRSLVSNNAQVAEFNRNIGDYNARCGSFRYRRGHYNRAKRDVEKQRQSIETVTRLQFRATAAEPVTNSATRRLQPELQQAIPTNDQEPDFKALY